MFGGLFNNLGGYTDNGGDEKRKQREEDIYQEMTALFNKDNKMKFDNTDMSEIRTKWSTDEDAELISNAKDRVYQKTVTKLETENKERGNAAEKMERRIRNDLYKKWKAADVKTWFMDPKTEEYYQTYYAELVDQNKRKVIIDEIKEEMGRRQQHWESLKDQLKVRNVDNALLQKEKKQIQLEKDREVKKLQNEKKDLDDQYMKEFTKLITSKKQEYNTQHLKDAESIVDLTTNNRRLKYGFLGVGILSAGLGAFIGSRSSSNRRQKDTNNKTSIE